MRRHAYLIMAHAQFEQLALLLSLLDDARNDIYLHIDKKAGAVDEKPLTAAVSRAGLYLTNRIRVQWGAFSQVECELLLLRTARAHGPYRYYHLLSGADLPLKTQDEIHTFFKEHEGTEFVNVEAPELSGDRLARVRYWHLFRENENKCLRAISRGLWEAQRVLRVDRLRRCSWKLQKGANWFSITENLVDFTLKNEKPLRKMLRCSRYPDEMLIQTALVNSPYWKNRYTAEYGPSVGNLRRIDWNRGTPYTWRMEDLPELLAADDLFARKFLMEVDAGVIMALAQDVEKGDGNIDGNTEENQRDRSNL